MERWSLIGHWLADTGQDVDSQRRWLLKSTILHLTDARIPGDMQETLDLLGTLLQETPGPLVISDHDTLMPVMAWVGWFGLEGERVNDIMRQLLAGGCDLEATEDDGKTALMLAADTFDATGGTQRWGDSIDRLLDFGADWQSLERRVAPAAWQHIQQHPRVRAQRLAQVATSHDTYDEPLAMGGKLKL
jgi:hypothetical protein